MPKDKELEISKVEYAALTSYANNVISHRLTIFGFFLPAVALLIVKYIEDGGKVLLGLGLLLTFVVYVFELRARILTHFLYGRGIEIEQSLWGYKNRESIRDPFVSGVNPIGLKQLFGKDPKVNNYYRGSVSIFGRFEFRSEYITYSFALDLAYILVFLILSFMLFENPLANFFTSFFLQENEEALATLAAMISAGGIFGALTKFKSPFLHSSFWGSNPYSMKADTIDTATSWGFAIFAVAGLSLQLFISINQKGFSFFRPVSSAYWDIFWGALIIVIALMIILRIIVLKIARKIWQPKILSLLSDAYESMLKKFESQNEKDISSGLETLGRLEDLLELPERGLNLEARIQRVRAYYSDYSV